MEQIVKTVRRIGNGGHIYLPKETVGQKVVIQVVVKTRAEIEEEILRILRPHLKHIEGIYLYGSHARGDQTAESDIDVLVITDGKVKIRKHVNEYEIDSLTIEQVGSSLKSNAVIILPILKEAVPILNQGLIGGYQKSKLTKRNTRWYIETTESSLALTKELIRQKDSMPGIVYPLMMRLKGLHLIESLIRRRRYGKKDIYQHLSREGISMAKAEQLYRMYTEHRDKKKISPYSLNHSDIEHLYRLVYDYYLKVRGLWARLS